MGDGIGSDSSGGAACDDDDDVPDCERPPTIEVKSGESLSLEEGSGGHNISSICLSEEQKEERKKRVREKKKLKKLDQEKKKLDETQKKEDAQVKREARPEVSGFVVAEKKDKAKVEAPAADGVGKNTERNRKHKQRVKKNEERKRQEEEAKRKEAEDREKEEKARHEAAIKKAQEVDQRRKMLKSLNKHDIEDCYSMTNTKSKKKPPPAKVDIVSNKGEATLAIECPADDKNDERSDLGPAQTESNDEKEVPEQSSATQPQFYDDIWNRMAEARAKGEGEKTKCSDDVHAEMLQEFLTDYKRNEGEKEFYPAQVLSLKQIGSYNLTIEFDHLLSDVKYKDLVVRIGRTASNDWLNGAVAQFFRANGMADEDFVSLRKKVSLTFNGKKSLVKLPDFMRRKPLWKTTINGEVPLTQHGRMSTRVLICRVLDNHVEKKSFNGRFAQEDVLLGDDFCWIYGDLLENQRDPSYAADFTRIWEVVSPYYQLFNAQNKLVFPLKFQALESSLKLTKIGVGKAQTEAVRNFLRYHCSLASPEANRWFAVELRRSLKDFGHQNKPFLRSIPDGPWQDWRVEQSVTTADWRRNIANTSPVLSEVMNYKTDNAKTTDGSKQAMSDGSKQATFGSSKQAMSGGSKQASSGGSKPEQKDPFDKTVWGLLNFKRCVIEHGHEHTGGSFVIENSNSIEVHASHHLPDLLLYLLYNMLEDVELSGEDSKYASLWIIYKGVYDKGHD